jgi:hypothetical protein
MAEVKSNRAWREECEALREEMAQLKQEAGVKTFLTLREECEALRMQLARAETQVETFTCPILSTGHVPKETAEKLDEGSLDNCISYSLGEYGWLTYTDPNAMRRGESMGCPYLDDILAWARKKGHRYVMFDRDAELYKNLFPIFDW